MAKRVSVKMGIPQIPHNMYIYIYMYLFYIYIHIIHDYIGFNSKMAWMDDLELFPLSEKSPPYLYEKSASKIVGLRLRLRWDSCEILGL